MRELWVFLLALVIVVILLLTIGNPKGPLFQTPPPALCSLRTSGAPALNPTGAEWAQITCGTVLYTTFAAAQKAATRLGEFVQAAGSGRFKVCRAVSAPLPDCPDCPKPLPCPACNCPPAKDCPSCPACPACNCPPAKDCPACNCPACPTLRCPECPTLQPQPIALSIQGNVLPTV